MSGDAPDSIPASASVAEKAKYQAWKTKRGLTQEQAMAAYTAECDRQIRVYGGSNNNNNGHANPQTPSQQQQQQQQQQPSDSTPRGIAAIPLMCAAAAESRPAYLRRLSRTTLETAWWSRQEILCGTPGTSGTFWTIPETLLLSAGALVEFISLSSTNNIVQSFFWPLHNCLLAVWMLLVLIYMFVGGALSLVSTLVWGSRRTGLSLESIWRDEIRPASAAVHTLCEAHQRISVRLVGLILLPSTTVVDWVCDAILQPLGGTLGSSAAFCAIMGMTWWYWIITAPFLGWILLWAALWCGWCFALIEMAGV